MNYTRKAWYVNQFDVVACAAFGPALIAMIVLMKIGFEGVIPIGIVIAILCLNAAMGLVVVHKAWGWIMLPVFVLVRVLATILASLCGLVVIAMMAYQAQAKEKISKAWTLDNRDRNYREGIKDAKTSEGFKAAGGGLWGFLVSHTLEFCEA